MNKNTLAYSIALTLLGYASHSMAQPAADLQGGNKPPQPVSSDTGALPNVPAAQAPAPAAAASGGPTVVVRSVQITGNKSISTEVLLEQLGRIDGQRLDMAGLNRLTNVLDNYYRASGYPFAQVYFPPQDLKSGILQINVMEGSYGVVHAEGKEDLPAGAQPFLDYGLKSGDPIHNQQLERTLLILDDQPGMKVHPIIKPGSHQGEADLAVNVERVSYTSGDVSFDNTGARSTGEYRLHAALDVNSPFQYGDKISLNAMTTNENMWVGSANYEMPLGASGLRGNVGYAHTNYQLGGQFSSLNAVGYANVTTAKLSYPLVRSQATNILLSVGLQHKDLQDNYRATATVHDKASDAIPVSLQFDKRDTLLGGGVTYGYLTWMPGRIDLDAAMTASDAASAKTKGSFTKISLDVARIQSVAGDFSLYGRYSGQWANKNLDSSEQFNLGGYYGVRAYPLGEGVGSKGWLAQVEFRYAMGSVTPFVFYDYGQSHASINPWDTNSAAVRTISGAGIGARALYDKWSVDGTLAWRTHGGVATSDSIDRNPRFFVMLGRRF